MKNSIKLMYTISPLIVSQIMEERWRQLEKWGEQNYSPIEWCAILGEEYGEVTKEALEHHFANKGFENEYGSPTLENYRNELIQVAAVAIAMIESLERNELCST